MNNPFTHIITWIVSFFRSGKAEQALNTAAALVPKAIPIVKEIAAITPNRTDDEIAAAFERYAVPGAATYLALPRDKRGLALFQLATEALASLVPGTPTRILNTAVQLAYTTAAAE